MAGKDTNQFYGPGGWRDRNSLEMGGPHSKGTFYACCEKCHSVIYGGDTTMGKMCSKCGKYNSIGDRKFTDLEEFKKAHPEAVFGEASDSHHVIDGEKREFIKMRENSEAKAYEFRATKGNKGIYHGPKRADGTRMA